MHGGLHDARRPSAQHGFLPLLLKVGKVLILKCDHQWTDGRPRFQTVADVVQPFEVDWRGELKMSNYIHRFSSASAHTMAQFGMTPAYCREHRVGLSTFEFQLKFLRAPQSGDRLVGETLVAHVGSSSLRFITTLKHASSQEPCAEFKPNGCASRYGRAPRLVDVGRTRGCGAGVDGTQLLNSVDGFECYRCVVFCRSVGSAVRASPPTSYG